LKTRFCHWSTRFRTLLPNSAIPATIARIQDKGWNPNSFVEIWVGRIPTKVAGFRLKVTGFWPKLPDSGILAVLAGLPFWLRWPNSVAGFRRHRFRISVPARFRWWSTAWSEGRLCRLIGVECVWRLRKKSLNHFPKFTKSFRSNRNHFSVDYYFRPYQIPKNVEIIFQKSFYAETNKA
jgi:hypothetical protein